MSSTLPGERTITFPAKRSLGELHLIDGQGRAEFLCDAKGRVVIPSQRNLSLNFSFDPAFGLSALSELSPDDLYCISFLGSEITDDELFYLTTLSGLRELDLSCTHISDTGLTHLKGLTQLSKLNLASTAVSDIGISSLANLVGPKRIGS
ncbi:MAG: hypothetical protein IPP57_19095 [Candidatus Obscuribacter sp.]|nr:hypothetical protein [Candidatus Obscuribacter sp.]